jgi:hypothetical protein
MSQATFFLFYSIEKIKYLNFTLFIMVWVFFLRKKLAWWPKISNFEKSQAPSEKNFIYKYCFFCNGNNYPGSPIGIES